MKRFLLSMLSAAMLFSGANSTSIPAKANNLIKSHIKSSVDTVSEVNQNLSSIISGATNLNSSNSDTATEDTYNTITSNKEDTTESNEKSTFKWPNNPGSLTSESAILMDASSGLVLYEKNSHKERYPASITKIMTTLIALENCSLNEIVTFSHNAVFSIESGSTHIARQVGEQLTLEQCLYAVMLASANEVSNAVAEHVAGSVDKFADMMNAKAKELGCENTHFVNANGLHNEDHYTSAYDMALISKEAMKNETFRKITATKSYVIPKTNKAKEEFPIANHQQLLLGYKLTKRYEPCIGGKTGYTNAARNTLVSFASKDGIDLICVVMKSTPTDQYKDTIKLFDFGFDNYEAHTLDDATVKSQKSNEKSILFTRFNSMFDSSIPLIFTDNKSNYILPLGAKTKDVSQSIDLFDTPKLLNNKKIIGNITYTFDNKVVGKLDIFYSTSNRTQLESVEVETEKSENNTSSSLTSVITSVKHHDIKPLIIASIFSVLIILILLYYFIIERPRRKRRKAYFDRKSSRGLDDFKL